MASLAKAGTLQSIDFAAPSLWQLLVLMEELGLFGAHLYGLFFSASDQSAFWYDEHPSVQGARAQRSHELEWLHCRHHDLKTTAAGRLRSAAAVYVALPNLFQNLDLTLQGNHRYDALAAGTIKWNDASVAQTLTKFKGIFGRGIAGGTTSLTDSYASAVQKVFGSPRKAYMVPGGSAVLPILYSAKAVRPLSEFGAFQFPQLNAHAPARVIGTADAIVMTKDSPAARALIDYLATPAAATTWTQTGRVLLSPNRKVPATAYLVPQWGSWPKG